MPRNSNIHPPSTIHTAYERYFMKDPVTMKWDMSGYDPNFIQNKISQQEVEVLLTKIGAEPVPQFPNLCFLMFCKECCLSEYAEKANLYKQRLFKILGEENTRLGKRGVHWGLTGDSNPDSYIPCLYLDFNKANMKMQMGNQGMMGPGTGMGMAQMNPIMPKK